MAVIFGTQGRDTLPGTDQNDVIRGWAKDDDPSTDLGDLLSGLGGNDTLDGGGGGDRLLGGDGADQLDGGDGADRLYGEGGADQLDGEGGDDRLDGGAGDDGLTGRGGRDLFLFARGYDRDTITDFKDDVDTIVLEGASLGVTSKAEALSLATVVNGNTVFNFGGGDVLIVENIADPQLLRDDIVIV